MAKEYFQDITPPGAASTPLPVRKVENEAPAEPSSALNRSIRDIAVARSRPRIDESPRPSPSYIEETRKPGVGRVLMWVLAGVLLTFLALVGFFFFRPTNVTVIPRSHTVTFSDTARVAVVPEGQEGGLHFTQVRVDKEETATLPAGSVQKVEEKAQGTITISNSFSTEPVRLIKNTRFENAAGLVYRISDSINVPGKKGSVPGVLTVKVTADQAGEKYNLPGSDSFTLPGLKSNAEMYKGVTAKSASAFTGGFVGEKPSVDAAAAEAARSQMRTRLTEAVRQNTTESQDGFVFPNLVVVTFETKPDTVENGSARLTEVAHIVYPLFRKEAFASALGAIVSADTEGSVVTFVPAADFAVRPESEIASLETGFSLVVSGTGRLIWTVNPGEIAEALAGKQVALFEEIVKGIKSVQEARSPQPFWTTTFPSDVNRIKVTVTDPLAQ